MRENGLIYQLLGQKSAENKLTGLALSIWQGLKDMSKRESEEEAGKQGQTGLVWEPDDLEV